MLDKLRPESTKFSPETARCSPISTNAAQNPASQIWSIRSTAIGQIRLGSDQMWLKFHRIRADVSEHRFECAQIGPPRRHDIYTGTRIEQRGV